MIQANLAVTYLCFRFKFARQIYSIVCRHISFVLIAVISLVALSFVIGDACSLRNYQKFSLVLFTNYCTVLHTFCRKVSLFIVNNFDSVLQLSIGSYVLFNFVW